jgi:bifunctional UDP-N-acetylglucosamine pyrophosphorylase/glucosamine-1-phosphate N-acetyltransferase
MSRQRAAIILAAGQGTRMKSRTPKVLHKVGGRAMLDWAIDSAERLGCARIVVVVGTHAPEVRAHVEARLGADAIAVQDPPLGTGHAVRAAEAALTGFSGDVVVTYADAPLVRPETIAELFALREAGAGIAVLGFEAADPCGYGRLMRDESGALAAYRKGLALGGSRPLPELFSAAGLRLELGGHLMAELAREVDGELSREMVAS